MRILYSFVSSGTVDVSSSFGVLGSAYRYFHEMRTVSIAHFQTIIKHEILRVLTSNSIKRVGICSNSDNVSSIRP